MRAAAVLLVLALSACAGGPALRDYPLSDGVVELTATPFFAQDEYQCGPAALAMVLVASGVIVTPEQLRDQVYLPGRKGSLQAEMVAATRRHARVPYVLQPTLSDLLTEVAAGNPVLVLQNLGLKAMPQWHYAVVIGYDTADDSLLLRSGTSERLRLSRRRFESSWRRADHWAMVAVDPGQLPATAKSGPWLRATSAFEELGQNLMADQAYSVAIQQWPEQPLAWQALANARYALGDLPGAEDALRNALDLAPSAAAYNNLAHVLLKRGCPHAAATEIERAMVAPDAATYTDAMARTRAAIDQHSGNGAASCPQ